VNNLTILDWDKVNILKYINSTKDYKIKYNGKGQLIAYTDSYFFIGERQIENLLQGKLF